jgi:hypothetical protein
MKTALEALMETSQNEYERLIQIEKEKDQCRDISFNTATMWCEGIIQEKIDRAIQSRCTRTQLTLMSDVVRFKSGSQYQCWKMIPSNHWDRGIYNSNAKGYYNIPKREGFVVDPLEITDILKEAGYNVRVIDTTVSQATSRTGKYADSIPARDIIISWDPVYVKKS